MIRRRRDNHGGAAGSLEGLPESWFGLLGVRLVGATTEASKIKILNRQDGLPVKSAYMDEETGEVVDAEDQTKGYETDKGEFIEVEPDEIKKLKLTSAHTLEVGEFVSIDDIDTRYLEKPYYVNALSRLKPMEPNA
jgi:DNA end-binding protein Ku